MDKANLGFSIIKLVFSATCYGMVCYYFPISGLLCEHYVTRTCFIINQIMTTACVAFTFIIEPALITASISTPKLFTKTILGILFSLAGFLCYIVSGSIILSDSINVFYLRDAILRTQYLATGSLFVATAAAYLLHFIYAVYIRKRSKN